MTLMTLKRYVIIRTLIVAFALLWMGWLYFSRPEVTLPAGAETSSCHPVAWRYQGENYSLLTGFDAPDSEQIWDFLGESVKDSKNADEYYRRVEERIERSCEIARSDRRMFINVAAVVSVGLFLAVPKPKKAERPEQNDSESKGNNSESAPNDSEKPKTQGA